MQFIDYALSQGDAMYSTSHECLNKGLDVAHAELTGLSGAYACFIFFHGGIHSVHIHYHLEYMMYMQTSSCNSCNPPGHPPVQLGQSPGALLTWSVVRTYNSFFLIPYSLSPFLGCVTVAQLGFGGNYFCHSFVRFATRPDMYFHA